MRFVSYKRSDQLTEKNRWYLDRYTGLSNELKWAYELKEAYCEWFDWAEVKSGLIINESDEARWISH